MRQQKKRYFLTSFLAVLFVGIGFWGYATAQTPVTEQQAKNKAAELAIKRTFSTLNPMFSSIYLYNFQDWNDMDRLLSSPRFNKGIRVNF